MTRAIFGLAALLGATPLAAQDWYVGLSGGRSETALNPAVVVINAPTVSLVTDDRDTTYQIYAGRRLGRHFAIEAHVTDLGEYRITRNVAVGSATADLRAAGWGIDVVASIPAAARFSWYGKAGVMNTETRTDLTTAGGVALAPGQASRREHDEWNWKLAGGLSYDLTGNLALRLEYEHVFDVGDDQTGEEDLRAWRLGLMLRF